MSAPGASDGRGRAADLAAWAAAAGCVVVMLWMGLGWDALRRRETYLGRKYDYYSLQAEGFLHGHLYIDKHADFRRESPDPAIRARAPYLLDASYFRGHWYLYFGAAPAALVLLPYAWIMGGDLDPRLLVVVCAIAGFLYAVGILRMAVRDGRCPRGAAFQLVAVPALAFTTAVPMLLTRAMFYELAIAAGYACVMTGAFWLYRALTGRGNPWLQLAFASLNFGIAVGCRPDLILDMPVVAAAGLLVAWWGRGRVPLGKALARAAAAAVLPAALVGAGLALYNVERFGSALEFGMSYSANGFIGNHNKLFSLGYLWPNLHWYYLTLPALSPYFPFVFPEQAYFGPPGYLSGEAFHGQFPVFVLAAFVAASALVLRKGVRPGRLGAFLALVGWMFAAVFACMCAIGVRADRYMVDFQAPLALGVVLLAGPVWMALAGARRPAPWRGAFALLVAAAAAFNLFGGIQEFEAFKNIRTSTYRSLEWACNHPSDWLRRMGLLRSGPVELRVVFPESVKAPSIQPLMTLGTPEYSDSLYAIMWPGTRQVELLGDHHGYGGPQSAPFRVEPGRAYTIRVDMGALYPPENHPFFAGYATYQMRQVKSGIHVAVDGTPVLDDKMDSYDAAPWTLETARNDVSMCSYQTTFQGSVHVARRLAPAARHWGHSDGIWRLRCRIPVDRPNEHFPLLSLGPAGSGALVFIKTFPEGVFRFAVDEWGHGGRTSVAFHTPPESEHAIDVCVGSVVAGNPWPAEWGIAPAAVGRLRGTLRVWLDGRLAWDTPLQTKVELSDRLVDIGGNLRGFSTAPAEYPFAVTVDAPVPEETRQVLVRNLETGSDGLARIRFEVPLVAFQESLPLFSSGVAGSGTMLFARVQPGGAVRFGIDEWSIGGAQSEPLAWAPGSMHSLEVFYGPLAVPATAGRAGSLRRTVRVWADGRPAWTATLSREEAPSQSEVAIGANPQRFSSALGDGRDAVQFDPFSRDESREFLERNLREK
jgi:hypothetical protein